MELQKMKKKKRSSRRGAIPRLRRESICADSSWGGDEGVAPLVGEKVFERKYSKHDYSYLQDEWANTFSESEIQLGVESLKLPPQTLQESIAGSIMKSDRSTGSSWFKKLIYIMFQPPVLFNILTQHYRHKETLLLGIELEAMENHYVIHPFSLFNFLWEILMLILLLVSISVFPVEMAFYADSFTAGDGHWMAFNLILDIFFMMNIVKCFHTAYLHKDTDTIIMSHGTIALHYARTCFPFHVLFSCPFDYIVLQGLKDGGATSMTTAHVFRLLRILRVPCFIQTFNSFSKLFFNMQCRTRRLICILIMCVICTHWDACLQYWVSFLQGHPENAWTRVTGLVESSSTVFEKYTHSFYRAWSEMIAIGYGMEPSQNAAERWLVVFNTCLGAMFYVLLTAHVVSLIGSMDAPESKYDEHIQDFKEYMKYCHMPIELQSRALSSFQHRYNRKKYFNENCILDERHMSYPLKRDILMHCCRPLIEKVDFFSCAPADFLVDLITKLKIQVYFPGEMIIEAGKRGEAMYFIDHGRVEVCLPSGRPVTELGEGQHFGEISLILNERRVASVVALTMCDIYCLLKQDFEVVLNDHPHMRTTMEHTAKLRMMNLALNEDEHMNQDTTN